MKKIIKVLVSAVLIISVMLCVFQISQRISSHNISNKNDIQIQKAANYLAALKNKIKGEDSGVISDSVKKESNSMDNKQLNVSSIKKIVLKNNEKAVYGIYLNDNIVTSDNYISDTLRITNTITGNTRMSEFPGKVIDYADSTVLVNDTEGYSIFNVEQSRIERVPCGKKSIPSLIDSEGEYILTDDGSFFCLLDRNSEEIYKLPIEVSSENNTYKPCISFSDDKSSVYYNKDSKIFKYCFKNKPENKEWADLSKYCTRILSIMKIKGENAAIVTCEDNDKKVSCRYVSFSTHQVKEILNPIDNRTPQYKIKANKVGSINRIVYEEQAKNKELRICIGEIKKGNLIKTTDVVKVNYDDSRDMIWSAYWNSDATRLYLSLNNTANGTRNDYLVNIN